MIIVLVRHGETDINKQKIIQGQQINVGLNATGIAQIVATARVMKKAGLTKFNYVFSSPLVRALETATILCEELDINDVEIKTDNFLNERDFGDYEGKSVKELPYYGKHYGKYESNEDLTKRAVRWIGKVVNLFKKDDKLLCVTHSHTMKSILHKLYPKGVKFTTKIENGDFFVLEIEKNVMNMVGTTCTDVPM